MVANDIDGGDAFGDHTFSDTVSFAGNTGTFELKPGGGESPVTDTNKEEYIKLIAKHRLKTLVRKLCPSWSSTEKTYFMRASAKTFRSDSSTLQPAFNSAWCSTHGLSSSRVEYLFKMGVY